MNEIAARLPSFLGGLITIFLTFYFARTYFSTEIALMSSLILASAGQFFLLWGTVHLDFTLTAAITGMLVSWVRYSFPISTDTNKSSWVFASTLFLSAAIGMLTKGPISIVLAALPIGVWSIFRGEVKKSLTLPWGFGLTLFLVCVSPWFYFAEIASPGFIKYFFINENFLRYVSKEYGDEYGAGHTAFRGASIFMLLQGMLPWSLLLLFFIKKFRFSMETFLSWMRSFSGFALLWGIMPALFFTLSKQLLPAYMLPGFGGCSIIIALSILRIKDSSDLISQIFKWSNIILPILSIIIIPVGAIYFFSSNVQIIGGIVVSLSLLIFIYKNNTTHYAQSVSLSALSISLLLGSILIAGGSFISMRRSTGAIIEIIRESKPKHSFPLGLIIGRNFSAFFYDNALIDQQIDIIRIPPDQIVESNIPDFIIESSQLSQLHPDVLNRYTAKTKLVKWIWFSKNS